MKLIFVNRYYDPDHSATSQLLTDLARYLAQLGLWRVEVVTSRQRYDDPAAELPATEGLHGVRVHRVWTSRYGRRNLVGRTLDYASFYAAAALTLWRRAKRGDVIIAMTDPPLISIMAAAIARLRGARLINWIQDAFPEVAQALGLRIPLAGLVRRLRNRSLRAARTNVVLGERMARWAQDQVIATDRITLIANWADGEQIVPLAAEADTLRAAWGLTGKFVLAYSGNLGRAHDHATIIEAADRLRGEADIIFLFIGGGYARAAVETECAVRGLRNVLWLPYQPQALLSRSLGAADVHWASLLPSLEGLIVPSKVYGILAAGRPLLFIGDMDGEVSRLLRQHGCGIAFTLGQSMELAAAILRLRDQRELCRLMGQRARAAFDAHYARRLALSAWVSIFRGMEGP